jgi:hypothetical protein
MPTITTEHVITDIRVPFWSVLKLVLKFTVASIAVSIVLGAVFLLVTFLMTGALVTVAPMLGM